MKVNLNKDLPLFECEGDLYEYLYEHHYQEYSEEFWNGDWYEYGDKRGIDEGECVGDLIEQDIDNGEYDHFLRIDPTPIDNTFGRTDV